MTYEVYELCLEHYIQDSDQQRYRLEEPLVLRLVVDHRTPFPVCINRMMDMLRHEVLIRVQKGCPSAKRGERNNE